MQAVPPTAAPPHASSTLISSFKEGDFSSSARETSPEAAMEEAIGPAERCSTDGRTSHNPTRVLSLADICLQTSVDSKQLDSAVMPMQNQADVHGRQQRR